MTLPRSRPFPSHTWPDSDDDVVTCQEPKCDVYWDRSEHDTPPPLKCVRQSKLKRSSTSGGGLKNRGSNLKRTPLSPVSDSNSGRSHQKDEAFRTFVREQPCVACGDPPPSDPAHYRSWGSGHGDKRNLFAACRGCHTEQHAIGIESWQEKHDLDLESETNRIWREYKQFRRAKA